MSKRQIPNEYDILISPNQPPQKSTKVGDSELRITLLGAGQEVGRSCCLIEYKGKRIVCDAGVHPAYTGLAALPFIDELDWSTVDALLITHFHLDHAAALTYIMEKTNFKEGKGKVYMTSPTKAVYRFMMQDFVRISTTSAEDQLFTESEMIASWRSIQVSDFNQEIVPASGVRFTPYPAGHVLGAAMFLIEIAGLKVLYTGDYSREEDRHLHAAEIPKEQTDVLIVESTYGVQTLENRPEKEKRFTELVHNIIRRGGRVLMPSFALGRAQELLLILDEYWQRNPDLHSIPIYYASNLARKCMAVYQAYIRTMNKNINRRFDSGENPFQFKFISELGDLRKWQDKGPCVMLASPGMLQSGTSRELLERWAPDPKNGLIICGYSVEGTMAHSIVNEPDEITGINGNKIPRKLSVDYISFSAHVDFTQNTQFIDEIKPQHVVLVHGALTNMSRLAAALRSRYADRGLDIKVHMPKNAEPLKLEFKPEMTAKAIGKLAEKQPAEGEIVQGLLVNKDFTYTLLDRSDLKDFAGLATNTIIQQQKVNIGVSWELIRWHLEGMYGSINEGIDNDGVPTMRIMETVDVKQAPENNLLLEWKAGAMNDAIADSVLALTLSIETSPVSVKSELPFI
ncbi:Metallo-hydrolase/oxidoreductase [Wallemia mellicola CBS 633.66]|uniref:Endoribonuclease YSH1 n=1 Tax=Wallemia mellicola (strain ATCC MYA-4683 / CBS 633.66) TaxID=671144 RepID=I4Y859_WALMC|nr:Metallo-hydrolase/oxidoreductase [Wallemia mellicola CBS 633.66]EIM20151.1 Metallo-hydrolase/oxidoreductase [Wallemia mellicola CBS 633.66]|eukprot:XP_006959872.1 Metallo-hydrolase/oxidoreductase [Wallemia mellicola CBS 633.66]